MTVETSCYVCGAKVPSIDGLCPDCTMREFFGAGAAYEATFGAALDFDDVTPPEVDNTPRCPNCGELMEWKEITTVRKSEITKQMEWVCNECADGYYVLD